MEGTEDQPMPPAPDVSSLTRVIALDGPAGSGKSTVARRVAAELGWRFVDTGAGYRAAALAAMRAGVDLSDADAVAAVVARSRIRLGTSPAEPVVTLDSQDVSAEIRSPEVTARVSSVSAVPSVRAQLVLLQRQAMGLDGAVVEGRDIATVVAPHAGVKVYLDADPEVRARRRAAEQAGAARAGAGGEGGASHPSPQGETTGGGAAACTSLEALTARDERDNQTTPLQVSAGAIHLDTTDMDLGAVVRAVVRLAQEAGLVLEPGPGAAAEPIPGAAAHLRPKRASRWVTATGTRKPWLVAASRPFGQVLFRTAFRVRVLGAEHVPPTGPVLIAGNHTGFLDGPLAYALSPRSATFLAKSELFVGPLARALGWLGQIPVHRGRPDRTALRNGLAVLQGGGALGVFPEGTRGAGQLDTVSDGVAYLALHSGAPVIPLAVIGTSYAMPKGARLPRWRAPVGLVFGPPFQVSVDGDPRARRTVRTAGEQIRLELLTHLRAATAAGESTKSFTAAADPAEAHEPGDDPDTQTRSERPA
ncbi:MAG: phospholipid/glycerol acyltransferase [Frankiales bacterium]|nr:phospholipid/glycerol acyltransferase [Frankiales bacterium]